MSFAPSQILRSSDDQSKIVKQVTVSAEPERYKGWPANYGMWAWGKELLVMFEDCKMDISDLNGHTYDRTVPFYMEQARSLDGGETWTRERNPILKPGGWGRPWNGLNGPAVRELTERINFQQPDFALLFRSAHHEYGPHYYYFTRDRGHSWEGPFSLPNWGYATVNARTDYIVLGENECVAFLSGKQEEVTEDGAEVFMVRTQNGGMSWEKVARANRPTPRLENGKVNFTIMPSSLLLNSGKMICFARCTNTLEKRFWIEVWSSEDAGETWDYLSEIDTSNSSTPPSATLLRDGRIVVTYGFRVPPYGIRARISSDDGAKWSNEIVLRADGGNFDIGYTRNALLPNSSIVTAYYYNFDRTKERSIEATIWTP